MIRCGEAAWPAPYETKRMRKDGTVIDVLSSLSPILDGSGAITGIAAVVRDITERNWIEAERREAEARHREAEQLDQVSGWMEWMDGWMEG